MRVYQSIAGGRRTISSTIYPKTSRKTLNGTNKDHRLGGAWAANDGR